MSGPQIAVVVGASGAVGTEVTRRLAGRGLEVLAVGRRQGPLRDLADACDGPVTPVVADVADDDAIATLRAAVDDRSVRLALLCSGLPVRGSVATIEPAMLALGTEVKIGGTLRLFRAVHDRLLDGGRFVAVAGTLGIEPGRGEAGPGVINAGLLNLMKQLSFHVADVGATVHTLVPGPMDTPRLRAIVAAIAEEEGADPAEVWTRYTDRTTLGRLPTVEEVAWLVERLLDPEAAALHGSVLHLDAGGLHGIH